MIQVTPKQWIEELRSDRRKQAKGNFIEWDDPYDETGEPTGEKITKQCCLAVLAHMCYPERFDEVDGYINVTEGASDGYWLTEEEHDGDGTRLPMPEWLVPDGTVTDDALHAYARANDDDATPGYPIEFIKQVTGVDAV